MKRAWFMTMPMPTRDERWVWIDMLGYIRAIYIPLSFQASQDYPHLSKWAQVNFTHNNSAFWRGGDQFTPHTSSRTFGLGIHRDYALGLDITGLAQLLSCPAEFRKVNCYQAKYIKIVWSNTIKSVPIQKSYSDSYDFSWTKIMSAHSGMSLEFGKAPRGTWLGDFIRNAITYGLGFIPVVGPILSVAFSLGWTAVANPDGFMRELSLWAPQVKLIELLKEDLEKSSKEIKGLVDERWVNMSPTSRLLTANGEDEETPAPVVEATSYFADAQIALNESGTNPAKYEEDDPEDVGEVVAIIPEKEG
ncbi:hypothetical protein CJF31_00010235 [Rutstroemia sp. NJR-2017a BVV2]|nr:hypothetical protein CJF31_00010235 [Rutstroemia sp. NJR-2017a BVV2]